MQMLDVLSFQAKGVVINIVASLVIIAFMAPLMLFLLLLTIFIIADSFHSYLQRSEHRNRRKRMQSKLFGNIADILSNQTLVRMFGRSRSEIAAIVRERQAIEQVAAKEIVLLQHGAERRMGVLFAFQILTLLCCLF